MSADGNTLQVSVRQQNASAVVAVGGDVDLNTSPFLRDRLLALLDGPPKRIVLDLAGVTYMDSSGVGTIVELKRKVERRKGELLLAALQPRVRSVFEITKLDSFFTIADTVEEALQA